MFPLITIRKFIFDNFGTRSKIKKLNFKNISKHTKQNIYMLTLNFT